MVTLAELYHLCQLLSGQDYKNPLKDKRETKLNNFVRVVLAQQSDLSWANLNISLCVQVSWLEKQRETEEISSRKLKRERETRLLSLVNQ